MGGILDEMWLFRRPFLSSLSSMLLGDEINLEDICEITGVDWHLQNCLGKGFI